MIELGLGAAAALGVPGIGRVAGVYTRAAYLQVPGGLVALTTFGVPAGPIHARADVDLGRLRLHDRVVITPTLLQAGTVLVDLGDAQEWRGSLPPADELYAGRELALALLEGAPSSSLAGVNIGRIRDLADLSRVADRLGGLGPGLTPAGDDCLAGILLIARIRWGRAAEDDLVGVAQSVETNDIAAAFLVWAARGQSIEPVHRFLVSAARGEAGEAPAALAALTDFGHSSGADLALGLRVGIESVCFLCAGVSRG